MLGLVVSLIATLFVSMPAKAEQTLKISPACDRDIANCTEQEREYLQVTQLCHHFPERCTYTNRLRRYQPNYAIYQFTQDDESAMEVHYSFRYLFSKPHCMPIRVSKAKSIFDEDPESFDIARNMPDLQCLMNYPTRSEYFFTYTGRFDFYLESRESGPVINRISNPGFHYRKNYSNRFYSGMTLQWINFSLEHRSNGQVVSADDRVEDQSSADYGRLKTEVEYGNGNNHYFDGLSRNSNYLKFETKFDLGSYRDSTSCQDTARCVSLWISAKLLYFENEDNVNWGPDASSDPSFEDYDIVKIILAEQFITNKRAFPEFNLGLVWTVGKKLMQTDSLDMHVFLPWVTSQGYKIPFFVRAHFGPMNNLSDYSRSQNSIGFGVRFD